jgi:hypothetical protein
MSACDHVFTLGIEEEFQIIDPGTRELCSHIQEILADGKMLLKERVKSEMHQSMVEMGTEICSDAAGARQQLIQKHGSRRLEAGGDIITSAEQMQLQDQIAIYGARYNSMLLGYLECQK